MNLPIMTKFKGPKKTTRPVPHYYIRLVAEIDPTLISTDHPQVKSEVIDLDQTSPQATIAQDSWLTQQHW